MPPGQAGQAHQDSERSVRVAARFFAGVKAVSCQLLGRRMLSGWNQSAIEANGRGRHLTSRRDEHRRALLDVDDMKKVPRSDLMQLPLLLV